MTPGETVVFRINNTAGFEHNFYIGPDAELQVPNGQTDVGLPDLEQRRAGADMGGAGERRRPALRLHRARPLLHHAG